MKILANDGISQSGIDALRNNGFEVITVNVAQEQLVEYINSNDIVGLLVRSATTARKELIDQCPGLKLIGRGGVGMDNIDVDYAKSKGLHVINTPAASSASVAELVFAHLCHLFTCLSTYLLTCLITYMYVYMYTYIYIYIYIYVGAVLPPPLDF